jgi:hypothetical protein
MLMHLGNLGCRPSFHRAQHREGAVRRAVGRECTVRRVGRKAISRRRPGRSACTTCGGARGPG